MPACLRCRTVVDAKVLLTVCTFLLCEGPPIEGCSAVLAVRRCYGFRSLVSASWCSEEKQVQHQKLRFLLFVFLGGHAAVNSRGDDTASFVAKKSTSPAVKQSCSPRGWYSPVP